MCNMITWCNRRLSSCICWTESVPLPSSSAADGGAAVGECVPTAGLADPLWSVWIVGLGCADRCLQAERCAAGARRRAGMVRDCRALLASLEWRARAFGTREGRSCGELEEHDVAGDRRVLE